LRLTAATAAAVRRADGRPDAVREAMRAGVLRLDMLAGRLGRFL
jgi:hypothetical protein